jgi:hypothetical protein
MVDVARPTSANNVDSNARIDSIMEQPVDETTFEVVVVGAGIYLLSTLPDLCAALLM